jgi:cytochrome d ubiquinol oxidase subunit II
VLKIKGFQITHLPDLNTSFTPTAKEVATSIGFWLNNYHKQAWGYLAPFLSISGVLIALIFAAFQRPGMALICNSVTLSALIVTAGFTLFPFLLPSSSVPNHSLTIWDAASSKLTLSWMFWATLIFLPIVLSYTIWVFRVMRGKVLEKDLLTKQGSY